MVLAGILDAMALKTSKSKRLQDLVDIVKQPGNLEELRQRAGTTLKEQLRPKHAGERTWRTWYDFLQRNVFEGADNTVRTELDAMVVKDEGDARSVPVVALGTAMMRCASAVRNAGLMEVDNSGDPGELPNWSEVPRQCGFKLERPGGRAQRHYASEEERAAQCLEYAHYKNWAFRACCLSEEEVKEQLAKAAGLHNSKHGRGDLPKAFQQNSRISWLSTRDHATLLCRVVGRRKAASSSEVGGLGGREEM